jgi:pimeloyl-ACP methyl ester carboxylesterase
LPDDPTRSLVAKGADALLQMARDALAGRAGGGAASENYQVVVHVDAAAICGQGGQSDLPLPTVRRLCCDGAVVPIIHGDDGQALDVGRKQRAVPTALKRALFARDRGCTFPGVTMRATLTHTTFTIGQMAAKRALPICWCSAEPIIASSMRAAFVSSAITTDATLRPPRWSAGRGAASSGFESGREGARDVPGDSPFRGISSRRSSIRGWRPLRNMVTLLALVALVYFGLCAALFLVQRNLIYFPQPRSHGSGATTLTLPTDGAQVLVTARERSGPNALLYFGGNAEDVSYSLPSVATAFPDHALYLLHYRGYGGSSGKPSEAALFADALVLFDRAHTDHRNIVVVGRSLGSGVAIHLASLRPVARLVLVTPFDSLQDLAAQQFPFFPVRWLLLDKFESWRYAEQVTAPTLIVAAEHDEVIPRTSTEALYKRFRTGVASFEVVAGTNHNTVSESPDYVPLLQSR